MSGPEILRGVDREERKVVIKEALNEWLNCQFARFGRWSARGLVAAVIVAVAYLFFVSHGWVRMP